MALYGSLQMQGQANFDVSVPSLGTSILGFYIKNEQSTYKEVSGSLRLNFHHFIKPILSWETSIEQRFLELLPWTSCLVDSQQPQTPSSKGEKQLCVATTAQIILLDQSLKWVYFQRFAAEANNQYKNIIIVVLSQ